MSNDDMRNEKLYQTTMYMAKKLFADGVISEKDYCQIDTIFLEKYKPIFGTLFSSIPLTNKG